MQRQPLAESQRDRIAAGLPFVESLARRVASSMPHSIELSDLVQDGMIGLIDAARRYDDSRGIKFETFAERRVRGAMIDALRRDAWPRGVRRQRRELEAAREELRRELGAEPSLADLAARLGSDETRLGKTIVRINTIESTSPLSAGDNVDGASLPPALCPSEPVAPDRAYESSGNPRSDSRRNRVAAAARAQGHRPLLLRGSDDERDWRRHRRQRIACLPTARSSGSSIEEGARRGVRSLTGHRLPEHDATDPDGAGGQRSRARSAAGVQDAVQRSGGGSKSRRTRSEADANCRRAAAHRGSALTAASRRPAL